MSRRTAAWLAWSLCALCVVLIMLALVLDFMMEESSLIEAGLRYYPGFAMLTGVLSLAYPTVGALIASRLPANPSCWHLGRRCTTLPQPYAPAFTPKSR